MEYSQAPNPKIVNCFFFSFTSFSPSLLSVKSHYIHHKNISTTITRKLDLNQSDVHMANCLTSRYRRENAFGFPPLKHNLQVTQGMDAIWTVQNSKRVTDLKRNYHPNMNTNVRGLFQECQYRRLEQN